MPAELPSQKNLFTGGLDLDTDKQLVDKDDYTYALNVRNGINTAGKFGLVTNTKGNTLVSYTQPAGSNVVIGSIEDTSNGYLYFFVANSNNDDQIRRYRPDTGVVELIAQWDAGWELDKVITAINLVDSKLLYWTDTEPRKINVEKAYVLDKMLCWDLIPILNGSDNIIRITNQLGNTENFTFDPTTETLEQIVTRFNLLATYIWSGFLEAELCGNYIEICQLQNNNGFSIDAVTNVQVLADNFYPQVNEFVTQACKVPLNCPPEITLYRDTDVNYNKIEDKYFQFATRIVYDDNEKSVLSTYSDINLSRCNRNFNYIEVDFTDQFGLITSNPNKLAIVKGIELYVRQLNVVDSNVQTTGRWRLVDSIDRADLWANYQNGLLSTKVAYDFYNDGVYSVLDDATANRQFDAIPIKPTDNNYSISQEYAGKRLFYGNFIENYDKPCIDVTKEVTFVPDPLPRRFNINGLIRVVNPHFYNGAGLGRNGLIRYEIDNDIPVFGGINDALAIPDFGNRFKQQIPEGGWPVYLAGTDYFAISKQNTVSTISYSDDKNIADTSTDALRDKAIFHYASLLESEDIFSEYSIKGVVSGRYIIRVASHLCSFGDTAEYGGIYNLNNGRAYQKTSTNVNRFLDGTTGNTIGDYEITIEIQENGNWFVTSPKYAGISGTADSQGNIFVGELEVYDLCFLENDDVDTVKRRSVFGYTVDADGLTSQESLANGLFTEMTSVIAEDFSPSDLDVFLYDTINTDHNGYFYGGWRASSGTVLAPSLSISAYSNNLQDVCLQTFSFWPDTDIVYLGSKSVLSELYAGTLILNPYLNIGGSETIDYGASQVIVPWQRPLVSETSKTTIEGSVRDSNGQGIAGVSVAYERTGRQEVTDSDGNFSIVAYVDSTDLTDSRNLDELIINSPQDCRVEFTNNLSYISFLLEIDPFGTTYNSTNPYAPAFLNSVLASLISVQLQRYYKSGGNYRFALMFIDKANRRSAIYTEEELDFYVPYLTEDIADTYPSLGSQQGNGVFSLSLNVTSVAPDWAEYLYVLRTKDTINSSFLQMPLAEALYVQRYDSDNDVVIETTFETRTANEIYLGFNQSVVSYDDFNSDSKKSAWVYRDGDRVRFIRNADGQLYSELIDLPISGERDNYLIIEALDSLGKVDAGTLVEVYRPRPQDDQELFYEIHSCTYVGGVFAGLPIGTISIDTGDTYRRTRIVPVAGQGTFPVYIEDDSVTDFEFSNVEDIGRINIEDDTFGQLVRTNAIRFSNIFLPDTKLNGLSSFEGANVVDVGRNWGALKALKVTDSGDQREVMLGIYQNRVLSYYIGSSILTDLTGSDIVSLSNDVLGAYRALKGDYGTNNPESIGFKDGNVYFWDITRKKVVRYSNNGLDAISDIGVRSYADGLISSKTIGVYDDFYDNYLFTATSDGETYTTLAWAEGKNRWISFYSFTPEYYGTSYDRILSFKEGECWLHDTNATRNNFYGTQYNSQIRVINKEAPLSIKMYYHARVQGSKIWYMPEISTIPNASYPTGMASRLKRDNWGLYEGDWWADFLRDINDPAFFGQPLEALFNGRQLRGVALDVILENEDTTEATLRMLECFVAPSERTN